MRRLGGLGGVLTTLSSLEIVSMEQKDIRRDFIAQFATEPLEVAGIGVVAEAGEAFVVDETSVAEKVRPRDLAVAGMRIAGLREFVDPELLGWYLYTGSVRHRRETVLRQSVLLGLGAGDRDHPVRQHPDGDGWRPAHSRQPGDHLRDDRAATRVRGIPAAVVQPGPASSRASGVPDLGASVAGVGVGVFAFVDARVAFEAHIGAGVIRDAAITAELDLDHPELATLHGHGEFFVPAYAGLTLDVGGGLRARAAVAYVQGRVGLQGTVGVQADASAGLDVDWSPTSGLAVETRVAANVRPKFRLSANASVTIGVDLLVTDLSHTFGPWERTLGEFGPDMELGVEFPVRWSEASGLDLSIDNIVVHQPTLDARSLMTSVFDQLAG